MTLSVMEKNTSQRKKIWRCRLCYVKPGGHVEDAFKQTNYWKKKAGKTQFISVYTNEVASLERNSLQKNKSKLYCPSRRYAATIGLQQRTLWRRSALTINAFLFFA